MFFRTPKFIRRWIRRRMHPMSEDKAYTTREKLSLAYMVIAWHAFGFVMYQCYKGNKYWPVTEGLVTKEEMEMHRPAYHWANALGIKKAEVYRIGGFQISEKSIIEVQEAESTTTTTEES